MSSSPAARPNRATLDERTGDLTASLASLTAERDQAEKAVAEAKAEHERVLADTATVQKNAEAGL